MTQTDLRGSKRPDSGTEDKEQMISHRKISSASSNSPLHKRILVVDDN